MGRNASAELFLDEDLGDNGGRLRMRTPDEFAAWVQTEMGFWRWLETGEASQTASLGKLRNKVLVPLHQLKSVVESWNGEKNQKNQVLQGINNYKQGTTIHSKTAEAKYIERLRTDTGEMEAAAALALQINSPIELTNHRQLRGAVAMIGFKNGVDQKGAIALRRSVNELLRTVRKQHETAVTEAENLRTKLNRLVDDQEDIKARGLSLMAQAIRDARTKAESQRSSTAEELSRFEDFYRDGLALQAPVSYWRSKKERHVLLTRLFFAVFLTSILAIATAGTIYLPATKVWDLEFWLGVDFAFSALVFVVVGIVVALLRIPLRLAMSQLHLGNDASERVTMVETYLALRDGGQAGEESINIVLERLFAPAGDGIVKDDLGPTTILDVLKSARS